MKYDELTNNPTYCFLRCSNYHDNCYLNCISDYTCEIFISNFKLIKYLKEGNKVWAIQNIQSDNEKFKEIAKLIMNNVEIEHEIYSR